MKLNLIVRYWLLKALSADMFLGGERKS